VLEDGYGSEGEKRNTTPDGLLYMVYKSTQDLDDDIKVKDVPPGIVPIYIGKTETLGRNGTFSANLKGVANGKNMQYLARWGTDKARHIGGLSAAFFREENPYPSTDYENWIKWMFEVNARSGGKAILKSPVYFTVRPWNPNLSELQGITRLSTPAVEAIMIGIARAVFSLVMTVKQGR
jgi:hypothetical protein